MCLGLSQREKGSLLISSSCSLSAHMHAEVLQLYQVGTMEPLLTKQVTKGQGGTYSRSCNYRALVLIFTRAVFQIALCSLVSKVVPSDGMPCGEIAASHGDWSCGGLCPRLGRAFTPGMRVNANAPPTSTVQICQLHTTPRCPRQNRQLFSEARWPGSFARASRSYLDLEPLPREGYWQKGVEG